MKLPWLLALPLLLGGGAVSALGKVEIVGDKVPNPQSQLLLGKGTAFQEQDRAVNQRSRDGASIRSSSSSANANPIDIDTIIILPKNQTKPSLNIQSQATPHPNQHQAAVPITTSRTSNPPPGAADSESQQPEPSTPDHDPDPNPASSTSPLKGAETRNPASANRAIAGMGAGLVSVMLVFFVFL